MFKQHVVPLGQVLPSSNSGILIRVQQILVEKKINEGCKKGRGNGAPVFLFTSSAPQKPVQFKLAIL